jgi:hypothetical protein
VERVAVAVHPPSVAARPHENLAGVIESGSDHAHHAAILLLAGTMIGADTGMMTEGTPGTDHRRWTAGILRRLDVIEAALQPTQSELENVHLVIDHAPLHPNEKESLRLRPAATTGMEGHVCWIVGVGELTVRIVHLGNLILPIGLEMAMGLRDVIAQGPHGVMIGTTMLIEHVHAKMNLRRPFPALPLVDLPLLSIPADYD